MAPPTTELDFLKLMAQQMGAVEDATVSLTYTAGKLDTSFKSLSEGAKKLKLAESDLVRTRQAALANMPGSAKAYKDAIRDYKEMQKALDDAKEELEKFTKSSKSATAGIEALIQGVTKSLNTFKNFASLLGVTTFGIGDLAKAGLQYNRSLFEMSRAQNALGGGMKDIASFMETVASKTNLSKIQFADFAQTVTSSMIGVKMSLNEVADLSSTLSEIVGPSLEAQKQGAKDLMAVQSQMPSLYKDIYKGMQLVIKIKEGKGNDADKEALAILRNKVQMNQQVTSQTVESQSKIREMMTEVTEENIKQMELEKKHQALTKEIDDAKIKFFESVQPLMKKALDIGTDLVAIFNNWSKSFITLGASVVVLPKIFKGLQLAKSAWEGVNVAAKAARSSINAAAIAQMKFNIEAWMNPYVLLATAIIAGLITIGYLIYKHYQNQKLANEEAEKSRKIAEKRAAFAKDEMALSKEEITIYNKLNSELDKSSMSEEEIIEAKRKNIEEAKKEAREANNVWNKQQAIVKEMEVQLSIIEKIRGGYQAIVNAASKFGMVNENAFQGLIDQAKSAKKQAETALEGALKGFEKDKEFNVKVNLDMPVNEQADDMVKQLQEQKAGLKDIVKDKEKIESIDKAIATIMGYQTKVTEEGAKITTATLDKDMARVKQQEDFTSKAEARLDTERKLMEAAQFGLGASITMMQKQVDLAYKLKQTYDDTIEKQRKTLALKAGAKKEDIEAIENAGTQADAEEYIAKKMGAQGGAQQLLNQYYGVYQDLSKKSMDQQIKIYDLTKNIREGYLDAMREMSVGAGEFEKIIGTQKMGVTQLMGAVDKFSKGALNTMGLGGLQSAGTTMAGVGTRVTGGYSADPNKPMASFINQSEQDARNSRIYGYGQQIGGPGEKVGTGVAGGREPQYMQPMREDANNDLPKTKAEEIKVQETATLNALRRYGKEGGKSTEVMWGTQPIKGHGSFGNNEKTGPGPGISLAGVVARGSGQQQPPAPGQPLAQPASTTAAARPKTEREEKEEAARALAVAESKREKEKRILEKTQYETQQRQANESNRAIEAERRRQAAINAAKASPKTMEFPQYNEDTRVRTNDTATLMSSKANKTAELEKAQKKIAKMEDQRYAPEVANPTEKYNSEASRADIDAFNKDKIAKQREIIQQLDSEISSIDQRLESNRKYQAIDDERLVENLAALEANKKASEDAYKNANKTAELEEAQETQLEKAAQYEAEAAAAGKEWNRLKQAGRQDEAAALKKKFLAANPDSHAAKEEAKRNEKKLQDMKEAKEAKEAAEIGEQYRDAIKSGQTLQAENVKSEYIAAHPNSPAAKAEAKRKEEKKQAALEKYESDKAGKAYQTAIDSGNKGKAEKIKSEYIAANPNSPAAKAEAKRKAIEEARATNQRLLKEDPTGKKAAEFREKWKKENKDPEVEKAEKAAAAEKVAAAAERQKMEAGIKLREAIASESGLSDTQKTYQARYNADASKSQFAGGGKGKKMDMGAISTSFSGGGKINRKGMTADTSSSVYKENKARAKAEAEAKAENKVMVVAKDAAKAESTVKHEAQKSVSAQKQEQANAMGGKEAAYGSGAYSQDKVVVEIVMKGAAKDMIDAHQSKSAASKIKSTL